MKKILITGANGEIGHGLINKLSEDTNNCIVALDLLRIENSLSPKVAEFHQTNILDYNNLEVLFAKHKFDVVFHLAALLSSSAERDPLLAHAVNTTGSLNLIYLANKFATKDHHTIFMFPSSIAVYGMPLEMLDRKISEEEYLLPRTIYGTNKLYVENLGHYFSSRNNNLDFRSIRFPGIISADTLPTGGTSDWGPEILHSACQNKEYECFVEENSALPFMVMPDAVSAFIKLSTAKGKLRHVYNVGSFTASAKEIAEIAKEAFGWEKIKYKPDEKRQAIVDSWPVNIDSSNAKNDWGFEADYDREKSFNDYLIPAIRDRYSS